MRKYKQANPVYETMTRWTHPDSQFIVRVWREHETWKFGPDKEVLDMCDLCWDAKEPEHLKCMIDLLDNISAIEVLDKDTLCGGLFYPDWH